MKKIAILVAMLAMMLVAASPAFADNDIDQSATMTQEITASGDVSDVEQTLEQNGGSGDFDFEGDFDFDHGHSDDAIIVVFEDFPWWLLWL